MQSFNFEAKSALHSSKAITCSKPGPKSRKKSGLKLKPLSVLVNDSNQKGLPKEAEEQKVDFGDLDLGKLKPTSQIDTFVGDISLGERHILFSLWKLLNKQIGSLGSFQCPQCRKSFSGYPELSQHLTTMCMDLFEDFFYQVEDYFSSKLTEISSDWNVINAFEFLKEKTLAFMDQRWCLLCGKTTPLDIWATTNSGSFLTNHIMHAHLRGVNQSLVYNQLNKTADINTISGTSPTIENSPTGSDFIKCDNCGKCFANNISLKIHKANEQKDLVQITKDLNRIKCGHTHCSHTANFSEEEIMRHFGLVHLELTSAKVAPKVFQPRPKTRTINAQIVPFITPLEPAEEDEIVEIEVPKKVYEVIDIDDSPDEVTASITTKNMLVPMPSKGHPFVRYQKNCIDWSSIVKPSPLSPTKAPLAKKSSSIPIQATISSSSLLKQYNSMSVCISCPVCNAPFTLIALLHQHLSNKHFTTKLTSMISVNNRKEFFCPDLHCNFSHKTKQIVMQHISTNHLLAFDIAKKMFPDFSVPAPAFGLKHLSASNRGKRNSNELNYQTEAKRLKV